LSELLGGPTHKSRRRRVD